MPIHLLTGANRDTPTDSALIPTPIIAQARSDTCDGRLPQPGHGQLDADGALPPSRSGAPRKDQALVNRPQCVSTRSAGLKARAWISESDAELVRVDLDAIDDLSFGWGLLARVHKGAVATYQRRKVNNET